MANIQGKLQVVHPPLPPTSPEEQPDDRDLHWTYFVDIFIDMELFLPFFAFHFSV